MKTKASLLWSLGAVAGLITTIYFTAKETPKIRKALDDLEADAVYKPTIVEKAAVVIPNGWKTLLAAGGTAFCILFSNYISRKQVAALVGAAAFSSEMLKKLKDNMTPEELDRAESSMAQEDYNDQHIADMDHVEGTKLFYETFSDEWFYATDIMVMNACYHFNRNFTIGGERSVLEFCDFLGIDLDKLKRAELERYGFSASEMMEGGLAPWIDFIIRKKELDDGTEYMEISYEWDPIFNYDEYYTCYDSLPCRS